MKLRSGKIIGKKELPQVLQTKLDNNLKIFKELLVDHNELAKEVLGMIANARSFETTYKIECIIGANEIQDIDKALGVTYGALVALVIGQDHFYPRQNIEPIYHNEIKERMLLFSDTFLVGDQINQEEMGV